MIGREWFSQAEAQAKLGQVVWALVDGHRIRKGTCGRVLYARLQGHGYQLGVTWKVSPLPFGLTMLERPPFVVVGRTPALDWLRKDQYRRYLGESAP
jgi:hypothetical protein